MSKEFTQQEVRSLFEKQKNKVPILLEALEFMQQHNGQSKIKCIALAMGLKLKE